MVKIYAAFDCNLLNNMPMPTFVDLQGFIQEIYREGRGDAETRDRSHVLHFYEFRAMEIFDKI